MELKSWMEQGAKNLETVHSGLAACESLGTESELMEAGRWVERLVNVAARDLEPVVAAFRANPTNELRETIQAFTRLQETGTDLIQHITRAIVAVRAFEKLGADKVQ